jgi:hypothetical protein
VSPFALGKDGLPRASEAQLDLAQVGALLANELVCNSRGLVEKPMRILFVAGGPKVELFKLGGGEGQGSPPPATAPATLAADRTGRAEGESGPAA